jgi:hypothetical protein
VANKATTQHKDKKMHQGYTYRTPYINNEKIRLQLQLISENAVDNWPTCWSDYWAIMAPDGAPSGWQEPEGGVTPRMLREAAYAICTERPANAGTNVLPESGVGYRFTSSFCNESVVVTEDLKVYFMPCLVNLLKELVNKNNKQ